MFQIIYVDPPWRYQNWTDKKNGAAKAHYEGLTIDELTELPVGELAANNAALLLWITGPKLLEDCHTRLFDAWGFRAATILFVWVKTYRAPATIEFETTADKRQFLEEYSDFVDPREFQGVKSAHVIPGNWHHGNGFYTASGCEFLMLGVRGRLPRKPLLVKQILVAPRPRLHSAKPNDVVRSKLGIIFPEYAGYRKIELFARPPIAPGWEAIGNEIDGKDIRDSLHEVLTCRTESTT